MHLGDILIPRPSSSQSTSSFLREKEAVLVNKDATLAIKSLLLIHFEPRAWTMRPASRSIIAQPITPACENRRLKVSSTNIISRGCLFIFISRGVLERTKNRFLIPSCFFQPRFFFHSHYNKTTRTPLLFIKDGIVLFTCIEQHRSTLNARALFDSAQALSFSLHAKSSKNAHSKRCFCCRRIFNFFSFFRGFHRGRGREMYLMGSCEDVRGDVVRKRWRREIYRV